MAAAKYWTPDFGDCLREMDGEVVMAIAAERTDAPGIYWVLTISDTSTAQGAISVAFLSRDWWDEVAE